MATNFPNPLQAALDHLSAALSETGGTPVDLEHAPWGDIEKSVIRVLGGAFDPRREAHQVVALGLAAALAKRLMDTHQAFFFPHRDSPEGAALGFPQGLLTVSPFGVAEDALAAARLEKLTAFEKDIGLAIAKAKFAVNGGTPALSPEDYRRIFDASVVQLVSIDTEKLEQFTKLTPVRASLDVREALTRVKTNITKEAQAQLLGSLAAMDQSATLISQAARFTRVTDTWLLLYSTVASTVPASEELWSGIVFPLLFIGAPTTFPAVTDEEKAALAQGIDGRLLFVESIPYQSPSPDENGFFGVFPPDSLAPLTPEYENIPNPRVFKVNPSVLRDSLARFDPNASRAALTRYEAYLKAQVGEQTTKPATGVDAGAIFNAAFRMLEELKSFADAPKRVLCVRRLTEAEAAGEAVMAELRRALSGPRIILAS